MATINMHLKFEIEIPKQTWLMLRKPCRLQTDGRTDGQTDKVNQYTPPPTSLGGGITSESVNKTLISLELVNNLIMDIYNGHGNNAEDII